MGAEKFNSHEPSLSRSSGSEWVQEATLYIPPTSHVTSVELPFEVPTIEELRKAARPNLIRRIGARVVNSLRRPRVVYYTEVHHYHRRDESRLDDVDY